MSDKTDALIANLCARFFGVGVAFEAGVSPTEANARAGAEQVRDALRAEIISIEARNAELETACRFALRRNQQHNDTEAEVYSILAHALGERDV